MKKLPQKIDSNFAIAIIALTAACVGFSFWLERANQEIAEIYNAKNTAYQTKFLQEYQDRITRHRASEDNLQ